MSSEVRAVFMMLVGDVDVDEEDVEDENDEEDDDGNMEEEIEEIRYSNKFC